LAIGLTACGSASNGSKSTATGNGDAKRDKLAQV
jgi:hypothetical protein